MGIKDLLSGLQVHQYSGNLLFLTSVSVIPHICMLSHICMYAYRRSDCTCWYFVRVLDHFKLSVFRKNKNVIFFQKKPQPKPNHTNPPKLHFLAMVFTFN